MTHLPGCNTPGVCRCLHIRVAQALPVLAAMIQGGEAVYDSSDETIYLAPIKAALAIVDATYEAASK